MKASSILFALLLSSGATFAQSTQADETAIKTVVVGHSQACLDNDVEKALSYYAHSPNVAAAFTTPGYPRGYEAVAAEYRNEFKGSPKKSMTTLTTDGYRYQIVGNTAFVTYVETYTAPDGKAEKSHKATYLAKEKGGPWQLIGNFWIPEK